MTVILTTMLIALLITSIGIVGVAFVLLKYEARRLDWDNGMFFLCATYIIIAAITSIVSCTIHEDSTMAAFRKECMAKNGLIRELRVHHNSSKDTFHTCMLNPKHEKEINEQSQ